MKQTFHAGNRQFGVMDPYIVAEIGVNHEGSVSRAADMIAAAAEAGAHAVKFQSYSAEKLASQRFSPSYWDLSSEPTASQFELFRKFPQFSFHQYAELAEKAVEQGVDFMTTCFDLDTLKTLDPLITVHKVASADITNVPLLESIGRTRKNVILSAGAASQEEVATALSILLEAGAVEVALLHCVLNYPTKPGAANLNLIRSWQRIFGDSAVIGYSDHVAPINGEVPSLELACVLGAVVIEKHFSDKPGTLGNDHYHSVGVSELSRFVERLAFLREMLGSGVPETEDQISARNNARRRVFSSREIAAGAIIEPDDLIPLRADRGVEVSYWYSLIGRAAATRIDANIPIDWTHITGR